MKGAIQLLTRVYERASSAGLTWRLGRAQVSRTIGLYQQRQGTPRMKVLFLHRWVGVRDGGTETHIRELVHRLSDRGHEVHVLTQPGNRLRKSQNIRIWEISRSWGESPLSPSFDSPRLLLYTFLYLLKAFTRLYALKLRGVEFSVVSVHFVTEALLSRLLRRLFGWPYVFVIAGYTSFEAREAKRANAAIAISQEIARRCDAAYGFRPSHIAIGVDRSRFSPSLVANQLRSRLVDDDEKLILCVCRLEPRKDLPTLIVAMSHVSRKVKAKLVIVGNGLLRPYLEALARKLGLIETVSIHSKVCDDLLPLYYRAADVFALPTLYEGLGIVFLEAMSSEIPIVSTRVGAVPETVGSAAVLVPPKDPVALANAITAVLTDDELRRTLIERGRTNITSFGWDALIVAYESVYWHAGKYSKEASSQRRLIAHDENIPES